MSEKLRGGEQIRHGNVRFVDLPDYFLRRYCGEINRWAENVRKIGLVKTIVLNEGVFSELSPEPEYGAVLLGVRLECRPWVGMLDQQIGIEIGPLEEADRVVIARHVEKMERLGVRAEDLVVEPPRVGMPFMPARVWDPPGSPSGEGEV